MWALLALYQALRIAVTDAVTTVPGTDPDRASYQIAVQTAQILVTGARNVATGMTDLAGDIGRAVLANLHGPRRPRVCARKVKSPFGGAELARLDLGYGGGVARNDRAQVGQRHAGRLARPPHFRAEEVQRRGARVEIAFGGHAGLLLAGACRARSGCANGWSALPGAT